MKSKKFKLNSRQIKQLARLFVSSMVRQIEAANFDELSEEEYKKFRIELDKIANRLSLKSHSTFIDCYNAVKQGQSSKIK